MSCKKTITFITGNANKLEETRGILANNFPMDIISHRLDLPEIQGDIEEVSIKKCQVAASLLKKPLIVEDSSLCYNVLKGLPGPYVKWFLENIGPEGLANLLTGWEDKSAQAICTIAYNDGQSDNILLFQGICNGTIVSPRGTRDFGWECIFQPDGYSSTLAELEKSVKYKMCHRFKALEKLKDYFVADCN